MGSAAAASSECQATNSKHNLSFSARLFSQIDIDLIKSFQQHECEFCTVKCHVLFPGLLVVVVAQTNGGRNFNTWYTFNKCLRKFPIKTVWKFQWCLFQVKHLCWPRVGVIRSDRRAVIPTLSFRVDYRMGRPQTSRRHRDRDILVRGDGATTVSDLT